MFFFEKNNIIKPQMDGMSFLFLFFEKNNIIKPKMDGVVFDILFYKEYHIEPQADEIGFLLFFF